ncbi:uncharacterized protein EAF01_002950 [Botrytis porri]|uniref:uncharacterized protein n=1 Tax=Botrytis porri TaxID=87229 RepID=UPI001901DE35|nr:uncharacterized protein EAF01_002950 [Botrytis porri]KAF7911443.1 hypothetical protein EAF01_002950 [Botrytis porri]
MESYKSTIRKVFGVVFNAKAYPDSIHSAKLSGSKVDSVAHPTLLKDDSIENEYTMSAEYLQKEAYHGSSMSYQAAQMLLWSFIAILIAPILIIVNILFQFRDSKYSWAAMTGCVFFILSLISYFLRSSKELDESYSASWGMKTKTTAQEIQDRIYANDRNTYFSLSLPANMESCINTGVAENFAPLTLLIFKISRLSLRINLLGVWAICDIK